MFFLNNNSRCLIATPISHLKEVTKYLKEKEMYFELAENANKDEIKFILKNDSTLKYVFINPNAQGYKFDKDLLSQINIKGINTCSTGTNHIDLDYCKKNNIEVLSLKNDYELINNLPSTSELAFCLLQALSRKLILCNTRVFDEKIWDYRHVMGNQISGKNIGCLGFGRLGKIFCKQLQGFNVNIKVCEIKNVNIPKEYERVSIEELFLKSDAIALHIHSCKENLNLINKSLLSKSKKGLILVNTSRGDICDEKAISSLLKEGHLGGYGTDVLETEFTNIEDSPIFKLGLEKKYNIIVTPHVGGMTYEGQNKAFLYAMKKFSFLEENT